MFHFMLNGTPIPGTLIYSNSAPPSVGASIGSQPATGTALVTVTIAGRTLVLNNIAGEGNSIILQTNPISSSTQITLVKVG